MPQTRKPEKRVVRLAGGRPVLRARELAEKGIHTGSLTRLTRSGALERVGPGRYRLAGSDRITEHHDLAIATASIPRSVICLVSALRFHEVGTQLPSEVWLAVPRGMRVPRLATPPLRIVNVSSAVFDIGIEVHRVERHPVRVYSIARTVADCFRFRNKIGLDIALEALREAWHSKRIDLAELNHIARRLRVQRVLQPYIETLVL